MTWIIPKTLLTTYPSVLDTKALGLDLEEFSQICEKSLTLRGKDMPRALLAKKMETGELAPAPIHTDVKTFPYRRFLGQVGILSGGFPCQPFSSAGERQSTADPRHLFPFILEGIKQCRPELVFLENVDGIISSKTGDGESVLKYVLRSLEEVDYTATAGVFSASEVGAPHQRKKSLHLGLLQQLPKQERLEKLHMVRRA